MDTDKDPLSDFELTGVVDEAGHLEAIDPETGAKVYLLPGGDNVSPKPEKDVKKFSGGGVVDGASFSRGTGAQVRGRTFRGVF
jgi:hypothetical protein